MEPKVYVSAGPTPLLDGAAELVVATCVAERGRPAATVSWETSLDGRSEPATQDEANGTATVQAHYVWRPQSHAQGQSLTCVVRHPALTTDFRIPFALSVQCEYPLSCIYSYIQGIQQTLYPKLLQISHYKQSHLSLESEAIDRCRYNEEVHRTKCKAPTIARLTHSLYTTKIARIKRLG